MTTMIFPSFFNSKYIVLEPGNWHLLSGAPADIVKKFTEWMKAYKKSQTAHEPAR